MNCNSLFPYASIVSLSLSVSIVIFILAPFFVAAFLKSSGKSTPDFDDFTEKASHSYQELPEEAIKNRELLKTIMEKYGFISLESEWWHYDLKNYTEYPVIDLSFDEIVQHYTKQTN